MPANKHPQTFVNNYLSRVSSLDRRVLAGEEFNEVIGGGEEQEEMEDMGDMGGYAPKQSEAEGKARCPCEKLLFCFCHHTFWIMYINIPKF